jgi:L-threonylcarbamoyladenylate synthase
MEIYNQDEFKLYKDQILDKIKNGAVFIHPTDTIYGLGCNAQDSEAVNKIRKIKQRYKQPFSVIAPSKDWIFNVCKCPNKAECDKWLMRLPGPYTLIISLNDKSVVAKETNNGLDTLGVRIPNHWFSAAAKESGVPIVTTSANITGDSFMTSIENLDDDIKNQIDFVIYEGEKKGEPSKIVDLTKEKSEEKSR